MPSETRILVFTRAPIPGLVKTRLIPILGQSGATSLHIRMIERTLDTATSLSGVEVQLWCEPDDSHEFFAQCRTRYPITTHVQQGEDLGARMHSAICEALLDADQVIIIGTDCPELSAGYLMDAIAVLEQGLDAVLGPAADGGYILLGASRCEAQLFTDITWGIDTVLETTRERLRNLDWQWQELAVLRDIDRPEDLPHFSATMPSNNSTHMD
jgi:hypothetical protein